MYLIAYLLSFITGIINPYIGIFSFFNLIVLLIIFCFIVNGSKRVELACFSEQNGYSKEGAVYRKSGKAQLTAAIVVSIICFAICVFIYAVVWLVSVRSYNGDAVNTPIDILKLQYNYAVCGIFLVASLAFHLIGVCLVIRKKKTVLLQPPERSVQMLSKSMWNLRKKRSG